MPTYYPGYPYPYLAQSYVSLSNLSPGDFVIMDKVDATTIKVKKDLVDPYNLIGGFVVDTCLIGGTVKVYPLNVVNNALAGLVIGNTYYADPLVAGGITNVLPVGTAVIQKLGVAISATELDTQYYRLIEGTGGSGGFYQTIEDEGIALPQEPILDFQGAGVTATAGVGKTIITIPGGGGGSPTGPAGGDLSGTYPNPGVVWANGAPTYDLLYYPLSLNPAGYLTSATAAATYYPIPTGATSDYIRGDGSIAAFPSIPSVTPSALTKVDDTNVTLTLGGTPSTALLQAVSLTLGWTGTLADARIASASNWNTAYTNRITSLTTTGSSGAATLLANVLNIPNYTLAGLGGVPTSRNITINGTTQDLSADRTWSVGTVTSVGLALPTEFAISGSPVTGSGTLTGSWNTQSANRVLAGPTSGGAATPTFRALVSGDIPDISATYLTVSNAALNYQPLDSDLTTIAGLTPANDDIIQRKAGAWTNRTIAQLYADLQPSVKDDVYFTIPFFPATSSPADATTYYIGPGSIAPSTTATNQDISLPFNFTVIGAVIMASGNTASGTTENSTMSIRNTTTSTSSTMGTFQTNGSTTVIITTTLNGLSINVNANDLFCLQWLAPTWATNPTGVALRTILICKRR